MPEIDLESPDPAKMFAAADNAKDYVFMLVSEKTQYTARAFTFNPNVAPGSDVLFKSPAVPDNSGRGMIDLVPQYDALKKKLTAPKTEVRAVVVATSREKNRDPRKREAVVQRVTLAKKAQAIKLKAIKGSANKADWITYHHAILFVEMNVKGLGQITFETDPKTPWGNTPCMVSGIWEQNAPGDVRVRRMLMGGVGDGHGPDARCKFEATHHGNWWPLWSTQINKTNGPITVALSPNHENYVFGLYPRYPGKFVLTVKGTGAFTNVSDKIDITFDGPHPNPGD